MDLSLLDEDSKMRFIAISGFSGSGKSSIISLVIEDFSRRGIETCVVKRAEELEIERHEGRFMKAGAKSVVVTSPDISLVVFKGKIELKDIPKLLWFDFLLLEGFKEEALPKIVVAKSEKALELVDEWTIAITSFKRRIETPRAPFIAPTQVPEFLLNRSPYFPLWTNCGLCGYKDCTAFLRNSIRREPSPCPAAYSMKKHYLPG
ncbi:MAG TPA: hypothetical protein ENG61_01420 [Candidatus Korarchaeota archaeon]|nr:hypothetical protein [Candidatus Korarchaeota archaeon]